MLTENEVGRRIIDSSIAIHRDLGPGLMEAVYEIVLANELTQRGLNVERQVSVPIEYRGIRFDEAFRADLIVESKVIVELKAVSQIKEVHRKQLLTYLRLANLKLGFLLNFGAPRMKEGIVRTVNQL